ncbi:hypothetical protein SAMN06272735_2736 [Streptomyces sp. TLI_55]|nr:hypothetical protein SAMN06272735_2736 [Streptomyces sp. TLI_55]
MYTHTRFKDPLPSWGEGLETMRSGPPFQRATTQRQVASEYAGRHLLLRRNEGY